MKILYFAWIKERLNRSQDDLELPKNINNVNELMAWLESNDEQIKLAFENKELIRVAVDEELVEHDFDITNAKTIAFFPPMTGG
ncbi:MAG: molybdopterin converting factor subunit 1 [Devosiaceae bacterium]|nr:molybdopterin converting factor subunit 1 [Devosiaceae bacterium]